MCMFADSGKKKLFCIGFIDNFFDCCIHNWKIERGYNKKMGVIW